MVLLIDNYDSFTFNIYQYLRWVGHEVTVARNDAIGLHEIEEMNPSHIIISPGPGTPESAGVSVEVVKRFGGRIPILGVCLGHQCIGAAFGADIVRAGKIHHGKTSEIEHDGKGIFSGIKNPFTAVRYHSLAIKKVSLPEELEVSAVSEDGEIMAIRHSVYSIIGVQFHPESIGTEAGCKLLEHFLTHKTERSALAVSINKVFSGLDLTEEEAQHVMDEIMSGEASSVQIACFLTALGLKSESVSELTGFARVMRRRASRVVKPDGKRVVDTCGTGGDRSGTFNISTVSAFVTAGAGVTVAKHGNRSVTSRCGSADVLEALGVNIHVSPERMTEALDSIGIAFLFAPSLHLSMKHAMPVRKEMGIRTVFNILGPLSNPAGADCQIIGVFDGGIVEKVARVLVNLGVERAMVVHGSDGLDEITLTGETIVSEINGDWIRTYRLNPRDYRFGCCSGEDLRGGDLRTNCEIALAVLQGDRGPKRDVVVLNSAAAIYLAGDAPDMKRAVSIAERSIDSGAAMQKLEELINYTGK